MRRPSPWKDLGKALPLRLRARRGGDGKASFLRALPRAGGGMNRGARLALLIATDLAFIAWIHLAL